MTPEIERLLENLEADIQRAQFHSEPDLFYSALTLALLDLDRLRSSLSAQRPAATPHTCPVCNGARHVLRPPHVAGDQPTWTSSTIETFPCGVCNATGIVWASRENGDDTDDTPEVQGV